MINRLVTVSLLAGFCAGLFVAVLQHFSATPLILKAETFENAGKTASAPEFRPGIQLAVWQQMPPALLQVHSDAPVEHDTRESWKPANGVERTAYTTLVTLGTATGFAFLLLGVLLVSGDRITPHTALAYAGAAFFALGLAPAAGLAPELPGSASAVIESRKIWWLATALASAGGAWLLLKQRSVWPGLLGLALLLAPHIIGAPHPDVLESKVPAELASRFTGLSIVLQGVLWLTVGYLVGYFWQWREGGTAARHG